MEKPVSGATSKSVLDPAVSTPILKALVPLRDAIREKEFCDGENLISWERRRAVTCSTHASIGLVPPWLTNITERICEETGLFSSTINHVLINEYFPDQGIMPHQDGPAYFPVVAILSLGSPVAMNFTPHSKLIDSIQTTVYTSTENGGVGEVRVDNKDVIHSNYHHPFSVLLMPCSLLIFKDEAYSGLVYNFQKFYFSSYYFV
ncbi:hypothetical protein GIB67_010319 [Kingdonia uniflora]|uniref:Alpha-ketoglutarate-dependent dioxygenase AlkB-like domain-containing protein n=1 Tax=Kingdonia uniflora TaxID=39325 RepID=A0A7J7LD63_9MAGN|nr:hypothetical protein GIB67_010319 [Kingdonia uniflora]